MRDYAQTITQLIFAPHDCEWQGRLLGLGSDGVTYVCNEKGKWEPYIPALTNDEDKAAQAGKVRL